MRPTFFCAALAASATAIFASARADAQACCAGSGALTPGRLTLHDDALVGVQLHAAWAHGSYDANAHYQSNPAGTGEQDFEEDVFGAVRVLERGQVALLVPLVETRRTAPANGSELGGGIGDTNLSARYDFTLAGASRVLPGIAALAGITFPTGTPPEKATNPLATDATGIGAYQGTIGGALEQTFGPWLVSASMLVALRAARTARGVDEALGTQYQWLAGLAYAFEEEQAIALAASYITEGDATIDGARVPNSGRSVAQLSLAGLLPLTDRLRLQGNVFVNPPISSLGRNLPAAAGANLTVIWSWI